MTDYKHATGLYAIKLAIVFIAIVRCFSIKYAIILVGILFIVGYVIAL